MIKKNSNLNFILILRDIARFFRFNVLGFIYFSKRPYQVKDVDLNQGRFDVLPTKTLEEDSDKRALSGGKRLSEHTATNAQHAVEKVGLVTSENYRQMYLEQQAQETALAEKAAGEKAAQAKKVRGVDDQKNAANKKMAEDNRFHAQELRSQIAWWQQQRGLGQHDDTAIDIAINNLQRELDGIPPIYWA